MFNDSYGLYSGYSFLLFAKWVVTYKYPTTSNSVWCCIKRSPKLCTLSLSVGLLFTGPYITTGFPLQFCYMCKIYNQVRIQIIWLSFLLITALFICKKSPESFPSWVFQSGDRNQYIQLVKVLDCQPLANIKQLPVFSLEIGLGFKLRSQWWRKVY